MILTDAANFNFSKSGKSEINKLKIMEDGSLYHNYSKTDMVYQKTKNEEFKNVVPNW